MSKKGLVNSLGRKLVLENDDKGIKIGNILPMVFICDAASMNLL